MEYLSLTREKLCLSRVHEDMEAYTYLTDEVFHRILLAEGKDPELIKAQDILRNLLTRKLYLFVGSTHHQVQTVVCGDAFQETMF